MKHKHNLSRDQPTFSLMIWPSCPKVTCRWCGRSERVVNWVLQGTVTSVGDV